MHRSPERRDVPDACQAPGDAAAEPTRAIRTRAKQRQRGRRRPTQDIWPRRVPRASIDATGRNVACGGALPTPGPISKTGPADRRARRHTATLGRVLRRPIARVTSVPCPRRPSGAPPSRSCQDPRAGQAAQSACLGRMAGRSRPGGVQRPLRRRTRAGRTPQGRIQGRRSEH